MAGDTATLLDGTYTEGMITFNNDGTAASPITIRAQNKWGAVLSSTSGCMPAIYILKSYITIDGLKFSVSPSNSACGTAGGNSWNAALWCYNASQILPSPGNPHTPTSNCVVRNNFVEASSQRDVGFKWIQDYATFENNVVYGSIEGVNNFGSQVHDNTVYNGDHWSNFMYFKGGVRSVQVYNNQVVMNAGQNGGITIGGSSGSGWFDSSSHIEAYNSVAYNNVVIVQGGNGGNTTPALGLMGATNSAIYNNVVIGGQIFSAAGAAPGYDPRPPTHNPSFANNILSCNGTRSTYGGMWAFTGSLSIQNNNFYNCTGAPSQTNAVTGDPNFVNASTDWHLSARSAATGTGATLSFTGYLGESIDVAVAKDGARRATPWDLGIYGSSSGSGLFADTVAPTVPVNLSATAVSSSQINLAWAASSDNIGVAGYRIYRQGKLIASVGAVTSYQNTGLAAGSYGYSVAAFDQAGNTSAQSTTVFATTLPAGSALQLGPISPASGAGTNQTFVLTIYDTAGSAKVADVNVMISAALSGGANTCWLHYIAPSNVIQLANDNTPVSPAWQNAVAVGSNLTEQNSQCSLNVAGAIAVSAGNTLTLTLPLAFQSTWSGTKNIYVYASDAAGVTAGYTAVGNWTVPAATAK